jgi:hypothetical protein
LHCCQPSSSLFSLRCAGNTHTCFPCSSILSAAPSSHRTSLCYYPEKYSPAQAKANT